MWSGGDHMDREVAERIVTIQEIIQSNFALMEEYREYHAEFLKMLPELNEKQQNILMDYLGICIEIHLRMLEEATK